MNDSTTVIAGIVIPSASPLFLAFVGLHVLIALVSVVSGIVAMLSDKRPGRHPRAGLLYYWCLAAVFATAALLSVIRWTEDWHLFIIGACSFAAASVSRRAIRQPWRHRVRLHIAGMGMSYILMLIAFYVDNGRNLPLWRELSPVFYWLLPTVVGLPIVIYAMLRHPLAKGSSVR